MRRIRAGIGSGLRFGNVDQLGFVPERIEKRILHGGFNQSSLEFTGKRTGGQGQRPVNWNDAGRRSGSSPCGRIRRCQSHTPKDFATA